MDEIYLKNQILKHKNKIEEFLHKYATIIKQGLWDKVYYYFTAEVGQICLLTYILIQSNINFLEYMKIIPSYCFEYNPINSITISFWTEYISDNAFKDSGIEIINYLGTKEEWKELRKSVMWDAFTIIKTIKCTDGEIKYE